MYGCTVSPVAARNCSSSLLSSACTVLIAPITEESSTVASASPFFTVSPALTRIFSSFTPLGRTICCVSASVSMPEPETVVLMLPVVTDRFAHGRGLHAADGLTDLFLCRAHAEENGEREHHNDRHRHNDAAALFALLFAPDRGEQRLVPIPGLLRGGRYLLFIHTFGLLSSFDFSG